MHRALFGGGSLQSNTDPSANGAAPRGERLHALGRGLITTAGLIVLWGVVAHFAEVPRWVLPGPLDVAGALLRQWATLLPHAAVTFAEIVIGFAVGSAAGMCGALAVAATPAGRRWLLPVFVASQAVPVFAIAPLLVIWFGFGLASKVAMASLIIFFPVAGAFFDGLRRTDAGLIDLATLYGASPFTALFLMRVPAALPALATGLRAAAAAAPIGAVVGEWVGSSAGLGFYMLHANARMQIDLMFAALTLLACVSLLLYYLIDRLLDRLIYWQPKQGPTL